MHPAITFSPALLALYAEIHYKFRFGFSLLHNDFPEIIADLPWRIEVGEDITILCLIKDADKHPIFLDDIVVTAWWAPRQRRSQSFSLGGEPIREHFWHRVLTLPRGQIPPGPLRVNVRFVGRRRGRSFCFENDNYRKLSHAPLLTTLAADPLPNLPGWCPGDPHVHSSLTEDQVEFGAPPQATVQLAQAMGLRWMAITDHSYDLDDRPGDPLTNDPELRKWHSLVQQIALLREQGENFVTLLGEEISCGSARGRNVHLLAIGLSDFIPGDGDSAERWLHTEPTLTISQVLNRIRQTGGLAYAAHPEVPGSVLERILLRRGPWLKSDYGLAGLNGMQIWNGVKDHWLERGLGRWVQMLLRGRKLFVIGGNDSHGNFNRFRQLKFPFVAMRESGEQIFGRVRTHLCCLQGLSQKTLMAALDRGQAVITDGPFVTFWVQNEKGQRAALGGSVRGKQFTVEVSARSSAEFGALERIDLHCGKIGGKEERFRRFRFQRDFRDRREADLKAGPFSIAEPCYLRAEAETAAGPRSWRALTNPIWLNFEPRAGKRVVCPE